MRRAWEEWGYSLGLEPEVEDLFKNQRLHILFCIVCCLSLSLKDTRRLLSREGKQLIWGRRDPDQGQSYTVNRGLWDVSMVMLTSRPVPSVPRSWQHPHPPDRSLLEKRPLHTEEGVPMEGRLSHCADKTARRGNMLWREENLRKSHITSETVNRLFIKYQQYVLHIKEYSSNNKTTKFSGN